MIHRKALLEALGLSSTTGEVGAVLDREGEVGGVAGPAEALELDGTMWGRNGTRAVLADAGSTEVVPRSGVGVVSTEALPDEPPWEGEANTTETVSRGMAISVRSVRDPGAGTKTTLYLR
jgi:hypothetical protein